MSVHFENRMNRLSAVLAVCEAHADTWQGHAAFASAMKELASGLEAIRALGVMRQSLVAGLTARKQRIREEAGDAALEAAGAMRALADDTGDAELASIMSIGRSSLFSGRAHGNAVRAELVYSAAQKRAAALEAYGVGAAKLAHLRERLDAFQAAIRESHESYAVRRGTSARLRAEARDAEAILDRRLDGLVVQFRDANPLFVEEYFGARKLVKRVATRGGPSDPAPGGASEPPNEGKPAA
jgi:hypothetical protein